MNEMEWLSEREEKTLLYLKTHEDAVKSLMEEMEVIHKLKAMVRTKRESKFAGITGNGVERHPYRPLPEAEKQGLTEEEIFQKEYGLYTCFVYDQKWIDKFKEIYGHEPELR